MEVYVVINLGTDLNMKEELLGVFRTRQDAETWMMINKPLFKKDEKDKELFVRKLGKGNHYLTINKERVHGV